MKWDNKLVISPLLSFFVSRVLLSSSSSFISSSNFFNSTSIPCFPVDFTPSTFFSVASSCFFKSIPSTVIDENLWTTESESKYLIIFFQGMVYVLIGYLLQHHSVYSWIFQYGPRPYCPLQQLSQQWFLK